MFALPYEKKGENMNSYIKEKKKIPFETIMLGFSFWMIFITIEGSFSIQILLPILLLIMGYYLLIKKKTIIEINEESKIFFMYILALLFSTVINTIRYNQYYSINTIIGVLYFIVIFLWYLFNTNKKYTGREIKYIINSYIFMSLICSILVITRYFDGQQGKIAMINLVNVEIDENYVSALVAMASLYLLNNIINSKKNMALLHKILKLIILAINILAIALSGSRASFLGVIICMIISYFVSFGKDLNFNKVLKLGLIFLVIVFAGTKLINYIPSWTFNRFFNSNYVDNSNSKRMDMWKNGVKGVINSPLIGYSIRIFDQLPQYEYIHGFKIPERVPAHQTYIDLILYSGIIGFIPFLYFLFKIFRRIFKSKNKLYIPMVLLLLMISNIIGAEKSVFFWNNLILLTIIGKYLQENNDIEEII